VKTFCFGAHDREATAVLHQGKDGNVASSLVANPFTGSGQEMITLRRLSTFLAEQKVGQISILKLDTEGVEVPILRDLGGMLEQIEVILLEYHAEADRREIDGMLAQGFTLFSTVSQHPHRGASCYVANEILRTRTQWDQFALRARA
jgi:hypothetical protein